MVFGPTDRREPTHPLPIELNPAVQMNRQGRKGALQTGGAFQDVFGGRLGGNK
jgi:hypothetical protein